MRKLFILEHMSLDGFVARPDGDLRWITFGDDLEKYVHGWTNELDTAVYGRVTYQMMESYWPAVPGNPSSKQSEIDYALWLNQATKVVVSQTLEQTTWENSVIVRGEIAGEINRLKQQPGKDMILVGSITLLQALTRLNLIDEYRININPIILGQGIPLFSEVGDQHKLKLLETRTFEGGVVATRYAPQR